MIDNDSGITTENDDDFAPSKSSLKRDAQAIRALGVELAALGSSERAKIPLPQDIIDAIDELNRTHKHGAHKRQLGWLAKRLRQIDIEPVEAALEAIRHRARANTASLHLVEAWRDRLLGDSDNDNDSDSDKDTPADALTAFFSEYAHADRQLFRQLQRNALAERSNNKPPKSTRQLFRALRECIVERSGDDP